MPQKIYDIKPPQEVSETKKDNSDGFKQKIKKSLFTGIISLFLVLGIVYFFIFRVEIEIWPETRGFVLDSTLQVSVDNEILNNNSISGVIFETDFFEETRFFNSTGVKDSETNAIGTVIVKNKHWDNDQPLVVGTRFETADGKIFRAKDGFVVPARRVENGEVIAGEARVEVIADEPGRAYNIEPTNFTLPGLRGVSSYDNVSATSEEAMIGGAIGERLVVSIEDINNAKKEIFDDLIEQGISFLKSKKGSDYLLSEKSQYVYHIEEEEIGARVGEEIDRFSVKIRARISAFSFLKKDLENLLSYKIIASQEEILENGIRDEKSFYSESLSYNYSFSEINWGEGVGQLNANFSGEVYFAVNNSRLIETARGLSRDELEQFLNQKEFIREARVVFRPFGVGGMPEDPERIRIMLNF